MVGRGAEGADVPELRHPEFIGQYRIVSILGSGSMGIVYEAEQQNPKRPVALKVVRGGQYVDRHYLRLFQREAQTLARLKHPAIAGIYEAGHTEDGQHYFAMELVRGVRLREFVQSQSLDRRARLKLFGKICDAINYAHQRGVIHRDIKPSNILIDRNGKPKILDFGVARITEGDMAVTTVVTDVGRVQGTLAYMSPEQTRGNPDEIDLRSDVYSLGIVLYELLTDQLPYDVARSALPETVRAICEEPPRRPSLWDRSLRGDLETIMLKALAKEPSRRYQSAAALAEDVDRFLTHQPILARPPGAVYQFRKLVARHKAPFALLAVLFALVAGFGVWMRWLYLQSQAHLARAHEVEELLVELFELSDPDQRGGQGVSVEDLFERAYWRITTELTDQPETQVLFLDVIARNYLHLAQPDPAVELRRLILDIQRRTWGEEYVGLTESLYQLGWALKQSGEYAGAKSRLQDALLRQRKLHGPNDLKVVATQRLLAVTLNDMGEPRDALGQIQQALETLGRIPGAHPKEDSFSRETLGRILTDLGDYSGAKNEIDQARKIRTELKEVGRQDVASVQERIIPVFQCQGRYAEAEALVKEALPVIEETYGRDHAYYASLLAWLGAIRRDWSDWAAAEKLVGESLGIYGKSLLADHPWLAFPRNTLAWVRFDQGRFAEAEELFRRVLTDLTEGRGLDRHRETRQALLGLGGSRLALKNAKGAEGPLKRLLEISNETGTDDTWTTACARVAFARCRAALGNCEGADLALEGFRRMVELRGRDDRYVVEAFRGLRNLFAACGESDKAEEEWGSRLSALMSK
jgi:tetratricopeptide (TPR) repeat protein/predicted Ser/Thr protein kinase